MLHRATCSIGAGPQAGEDASLELVQPSDRRRTDVPGGSSPSRYHVGSLARLGEDAVDPLVGSDVLAQRGDVVVAEHGRIQGVSPRLRCRRGVRGSPVVGHLELLDGDGAEAREVHPRWVHHERSIDALERPLLGQDDLASATLFAGGTQDDHGPAQLLGDRRRSDPGTDAGGADDVVAAGVPDAGEGVVLAQHRDPWPTAADDRFERRVHAVRPAGDGDPGAFEHRAQHLVGMVLLESQLGVFVDAVRRLEQRGSVLGDDGVDAVLGCGEIDHRGRLRRLPLDHVGLRPVTRGGARPSRPGRPRTSARAPSGTRRSTPRGRSRPSGPVPRALRRGRTRCSRPWSSR